MIIRQINKGVNTMSVIREQTVIVKYFRPELFGKMHSDQKRTGEWHSHHFTETIYIQSDRCIIETDREQMRAERGDIFVIRPNVSHRLISEGPASIVYIGCSSIYADRLIAFPEQDAAMIKDEVLSSSLDRLGDGLTFDMLWDLMMPHWKRLCDTNAKAGTSDALTRQLKAYIGAHLDENVSVLKLANTFYVNPQYLGRLFKKNTGKTVKEYHQEMRMQRAFTLLRNSDASPSLVAQELGFDTVQYFSTCFKKYFGVSPRKVKIKKPL